MDINKLTIHDFHNLENDLCRSGVEYFVENYVKIEDRDATGEDGIVIPFNLWDRQKEILRGFLSNRLTQILKANQLGLTWLILSFAVWRLIYNTGYLVLGISETEIKAKELIRRVEFMLRHLPDWIISDKKNSPELWYEYTALTITIHHPKRGNKNQEDSVMQAFASSPTAGASFTANLFLFDEWALQQYADEIWTYAFPTINRPNGGQVIGISTVERGGLFERLWHTDNDFVKIFLGWFSDPRRDQEWYNKTVRALGIDETRKHYPATADEAFAIPGGAFFSEFRSNIHLKEPMVEIPSWYARYRVLDYGLDMLACYWIYLQPNGYARIYREVHKEGLVISQAVYEILKAGGVEVPDTVQKWDALTSKEKQEIAKTDKEKYNATYAPPDLFAKASATGKANSEVWYENGIYLTKTKNDFEQGCLAMSEWLHPIEIKDEQTGQLYTTAKLTLDNLAAPNLAHSLLNIQKDKHNPKVYSKVPHILSHSCDAIRYFALEHTYQVGEPKGKVIYTTEAEWLKATLFDKIKQRLGRSKEMAQAM
jgi:hypothetical protein